MGCRSLHNRVTPQASEAKDDHSSRFRFFFSFASPTAPTAARAGASSGATNAFARSSCRAAVASACYESASVSS